MPRFVILEHDHPVLHWDLMLECGAVLKTWRLAAAPVAGQAVCAEAVFDHRPIYLDYEGPISGGRGRVQRWDGGEYSEEDAGKVAEGRPATLHLIGGRLKGKADLNKSPSGQWTFTFLGDP
jgi:hypothetical protein